MNIQQTEQHILTRWIEPDLWPTFLHDLHGLVEATQQEYHLLSPTQINDIIISLEWILNKQNFECDCEPVHEYDTNATTHSDNCALSMIDHIEATLDNLKKGNSIMFKLRSKSTGLWYTLEDDEIIFTEYKNKALIFPSDKRQFWEEEYSDEFEIVPLAEDELLTQMNAPRLPGF